MSGIRAADAAPPARLRACVCVRACVRACVCVCVWLGACGVCVCALRSESGQHCGPYGKEFAGLQKILLLSHLWSNYEPGCQSYKSTVVSAEGRWYPTYPIT